ncbi:phosphoribosyltransferase [Aerolutibacter ruishenii]|uniref:Phosphoribosyltransferase domain-containing protein n=1 Tax=Aerolutibacter ruishenii TaxID=686800 RepID=A0A562LY83_9GAMM|nr:phosphoribosyltransferase family protein [Lysobacter ruishenii]TWI12478.1 hypothetical protein IP93_00819 [Lysobacter ruishenii]
MAMLPFRDREDAGHRLAQALAAHAPSRPLVLAIPRGAVPMGRIIADALGGDLDVVLVRKLGAPYNPELAIGAVDEAGQVTPAHEGILMADVDQAYLDREVARQQAVIRARRQSYCGGVPPMPLAGRTVIVVDDGLATGATMAAALQAARRGGPAHLVCAIPVAARDSLAAITPLADEVVCLARPHPFHAVGAFYDRFESVSDGEVVAALRGDPGQSLSEA